MAEIKSTMELVLERAALMGKATREEIEQEEAEKKGMQFTAAYLNQTIDSLTKALNDQQAESQTAVRKGMMTSLLHNIFLARDEDGTKRIDLALAGVLDLGGGAGDLEAMCGELQKITGQYSQHREQLYQQLTEQMRMHFEQVLAQQQGGKPEGISIDPTTQPKFQEEWAKVEGELDGQYGQALEQYKAQLKQRVGL